MELAPGESALDAVRYAGGLVASASQVLVTLQRTSAGGITTVRDIRNQPDALRAVKPCEGDVLRALERVERGTEFVEAAGWVAVPGRFAYRPGMRVRDLLAVGGEGGQMLPDTYRLRGEILRTRPDGRTRLLSFEPERALAGEPAHDLPLEPRDRVELAKVTDLRLPEQVTLLGPFTRPGAFAWHEGMRAGDLLFRAGIPKLSAERHYAELARFRDGRTSEVLPLDLARLVSTETQAPVALDDDRLNPLLRPYDQITVYENPRFRMHRTVSILGQVQRPGPYALQEDGFTLGQLIQRAGGLTPEAMPSGGIFLRMNLEPRNPGGAGALPEPGDRPQAPSSLDAVNGVLQRLSETRRGRESGALEPNPLLHGLLLGDLNRMVVDFSSVLKGDSRQDVVLLDGDQVFIPRRTDSVYVVGEVASPFASFHVKPGDKVRDVLKRAGGYTRNADRTQVRLLKADGRVFDSRLPGTSMDPGDALLVPQRIRKDVPWQDTLLAMTPLAILVNALRR
jgi:protein involved in polysaccharide export with SLBB domain